MNQENWHDVGEVAELSKQPLQQVPVGRTKIALSCVGGHCGAIHDACNHAGGPLGQGTLDGDYIVCPWHRWKFHRQTGEGEPGFEEDRVPRYALRREDGHLWINLAAETSRRVKPHPPHPLARTVVREPGPLRVAGISTTAMDPAHPRYSTSEALLEAALTAFLDFGELGGRGEHGRLLGGVAVA